MGEFTSEEDKPMLKRLDYIYHAQHRFEKMVKAWDPATSKKWVQFFAGTGVAFVMTIRFQVQSWKQSAMQHVQCLECLAKGCWVEVIKGHLVLYSCPMQK